MLVVSCTSIFKLRCSTFLFDFNDYAYETNFETWPDFPRAHRLRKNINSQRVKFGDSLNDFLLFLAALIAVCHTVWVCAEEHKTSFVMTSHEHV